MNFKSKIAVIVGGTSGIGFKVAENVIQEGGIVIIGSRSKEKLEKSLTKLGPNAQGFQIDNKDKASIESFFDKIERLDYLFTPGATYSYGAIDQITDEIAESPFKSKFWGQYYAVKHAIPKLSQEGAIVLMSGAASIRPLNFSATYAACNSAIEGLGRALAVELSPIRVNTISPGTVDSELWRNKPEQLRNQVYEFYSKLNITGKVSTVEEVAEAVCFLLKNPSMTGSTLFTDGGYTMR
jgi:NAD(P)-dependent dehydrogenase (short-subunit alcohol dehydrogenase family)